MFIFLIVVRGLKDKDKMSLTKQHFKAVADLIAKNKSGINAEFVKNLCDYFASQNPLFNRERFLSVCGLSY